MCETYSLSVPPSEVWLFSGRDEENSAKMKSRETREQASYQVSVVQAEAAFRAQSSPAMQTQMGGRSSAPFAFVRSFLWSFSIFCFVLFSRHFSTNKSRWLLSSFQFGPSGLLVALEYNHMELTVVRKLIPKVPIDARSKATTRVLALDLSRVVHFPDTSLCDCRCRRPH